MLKFDFIQKFDNMEFRQSARFEYLFSHYNVRADNVRRIVIFDRYSTYTSWIAFCHIVFVLFQMITFLKKAYHNYVLRNILRTFTKKYYTQKGLLKQNL